MADWQPIETAPKDGSVVLGCYPPPWHESWSRWRAPQAVYWGVYHPNAPGKMTWRNGADGRPVSVTHWMPLPEPPVAVTDRFEVPNV